MDHAPRPLRRRAVTRDLLLDGALGAFADLGTSSTTVDAICERAGFTRGAFYSNFATKDELFLELVGREFDRRIAAVTVHERRVAEEAPPAAIDAEQLAAHIRPLFPDRADDERWAVVMSEFRRYAARSATTARLFAAKRDELLQKLGDQIAVLAGRVGVEFIVSRLDVARIALAVYSEGLADAIVDEAAGRKEGRRDVLALRVAFVVRGLIRPVESAVSVPSPVHAEIPSRS